MDWRTFSGSIPRTLSVIESNQSGQQPCVLQSIGDDTCLDKLHNNRTWCGIVDRVDKQEQSIENGAYGKEKLINLFLWAGKHSLEIYMIHGLLLNILKSSVPIRFSNFQGYLLTAGNLVLTIGLCALVIELLDKNRILKKFLSIR